MWGVAGGQEQNCQENGWGPKVTSPTFNERSYPKGIRKKAIEEGTWHPPLACACLHRHTPAWTCLHTPQTSTHKLSEVKCEHQRLSTFLQQERSLKNQRRPWTKVGSKWLDKRAMWASTKKLVSASEQGIHCSAIRATKGQIVYSQWGHHSVLF